MKTKIEIKSIFGKVLFTYQKENATIKDALEQAIKDNANLKYANLRNTNLEYANLEYANLEYANLRNTNLEYANLEYANLEYANLENTNLRNAKNKELSYLPLFCKWSFSIIGDKIKIGCKRKTIEEWDLFFNSNEIYETERDTEDFKQIEAVYNACKSYLLTLNNK